MDKDMFERAWESSESSYSESEDIYNLPGMSSLDQAVTKVVKFLGLEPVSLGKVQERTSFTLSLPGRVRS